MKKLWVFVSKNWFLTLLINFERHASIRTPECAYWKMFWGWKPTAPMEGEKENSDIRPGTTSNSMIWWSECWTMIPRQESRPYTLCNTLSSSSTPIRHLAIALTMPVPTQLSPAIAWPAWQHHLHFTQDKHKLVTSRLTFALLHQPYELLLIFLASFSFLEKWHAAVGEEIEATEYIVRNVLPASAVQGWCPTQGRNVGDWAVGRTRLKQFSTFLILKVKMFLGLWGRPPSSRSLLLSAEPSEADGTWCPSGC